MVIIVLLASATTFFFLCFQGIKKIQSNTNSGNDRYRQDVGEHLAANFICEINSFIKVSD